MNLGVFVTAAASSSSNNIEPGVLGFLVVAAIGVALVFLLRSMNKHLRKITPDPSAPGADDDHELTQELATSQPPAEQNRP